MDYHIKPGTMLRLEAALLRTPTGAWVVKLEVWLEGQIVLRLYAYDCIQLSDFFAQYSNMLSRDMLIAHFVDGFRAEGLPAISQSSAESEF